MKVLILQEFSTPHAWGPMMINFIRDLILRDEATAEIDLCEVVDGAAIPSPSNYDLIVMTGGTFNLASGETEPWVEDVKQMVQDVVALKHGKVKLLGFCWGHQIIHVALGGKVIFNEAGNKIGIEDVQLNNAGQGFFNAESLKMHKFHKRYVGTPASDFEILAVENEIALHSSNRILTFQAHPEMNAEVAQSLVDLDDGSYAKAVPLGDIHDAHDGLQVFARVMEWAKEP